MYARTLGSIRSGVQNGCHTMFRFTAVTPGSALTARSTSPVICGPAGQPGDVSVMSIWTSDPSTDDLVDEAQIDDVQIELRVLHFAKGELHLIGGRRPEAHDRHLRGARTAHGLVGARFVRRLGRRSAPARRGRVGCS